MLILRLFSKLWTLVMSSMLLQSIFYKVEGDAKAEYVLNYPLVGSARLQTFLSAHFFHPDT